MNFMNLRIVLVRPQYSGNIGAVARAMRNFSVNDLALVNPAPVHRAPGFNEHGDEILAEKLGLDWDTIVDLKVKGVVG